MSARSAWLARYRMARLVRGFECALMGGKASSLAVPHYREWDSTIRLGDMLIHARRNGKYGTKGTLKRSIAGPAQRLPA